MPAYLADIELGEILDLKTRGEMLQKDSHLVEQTAPIVEAGDDVDPQGEPPEDKGEELNDLNMITILK